MGHLLEIEDESLEHELTTNMGEYKEYEGALDASGMRIAIVAGRFNDHVTKPLARGRARHAARARSRRRAGALGARRVRDPAGRAAARTRLRRGDLRRRGDPGRHGTLRLVAGECAAGIQRVALAHRHSRDLRCARHRQPRAGDGPARRAGEHSHAGSEAARTAVEMVSLLRQLSPKDLVMLRLVLPKGSLEAQTLQLFDDADLGVVARLRRRVPRHHRRPARRRGAHPPPAGDPAVRGRGPLRPRHHRARLDRRAQRRRGDAHRAPLCEGNRAADPDRARGRRRIGGDLGRRPAERRASCRPSIPS